MPKYGSYNAGSDVIIDLDDFAARFPESFANAAKRGLAHKFNNECAAWILKEREKADKAGTPIDDDKADELVATWRNDLAAKLWSGNVVITEPGAPRGSGLESIAWELALARTKAILAPKGLWPEADRKAGIKADEATVVFAGQPRTRDDLVRITLEKNRDVLMSEAKEVQAKRRAEAEAKKAEAKPVKAGATEVSAEDLL